MYLLYKDAIKLFTFRDPIIEMKKTLQNDNMLTF